MTRKLDERVVSKDVRKCMSVLQSQIIGVDIANPKLSVMVHNMTVLTVRSLYVCIKMGDQFISFMCLSDHHLGLYGH